MSAAQFAGSSRWLPPHLPRAASSRRNFFFGRTRAVEPALRPPWALEEDDFVARRTRCDRCIEACPTSILVRMDGGFPGVDFGRGECTFSGRLRRGLRTPRAATRRHHRALGPRRVIGEACLAARGVECRVCGESCPEGAIRFRPRLGGRCPSPARRRRVHRLRRLHRPVPDACDRHARANPSTHGERNMNIASLVVRAFPADFPEVVEGLKKVPGGRVARAVRREGQHRHHHRGRRAGR